MSSAGRVTEVNVHVDVGTLTMFGRGKICGVISLRISDHYFPEREWNDFPVKILGGWLNKISEIWRGKQEYLTCWFMDGAFYFDVSVVDDNQWLVKCFEYKGEPEYVCEGHAVGSLFLKDMLLNASLVVETCKRKGWKTDDLDELAAVVARVEQELTM